nr:hypothetical protein [Nocardioides convexus]
MLGVQEFGVLSFGLSLGLLLGVVSSLGLDARLVQAVQRPARADRPLLRRAARPARRALGRGAGPDRGRPARHDERPARRRGLPARDESVCWRRSATPPARSAARSSSSRLAAVVLVVQRFSALGLSVGALLLTRSAWCAALGYLLATLVGVAGMYLAARRVGARPRLRGIRPEIRLILVAAPVMGLDEIASMGLFRIDAALIGVLLSTTAVGVYGASLPDLRDRALRQPGPSPGPTCRSSPPAPTTPCTCAPGHGAA